MSSSPFSALHNNFSNAYVVTWATERCLKYYTNTENIRLLKPSHCRAPSTDRQDEGGRKTRRWDFLNFPIKIIFTYSTCILYRMPTRSVVHLGCSGAAPRLQLRQPWPKSYWPSAREDSHPISIPTDLRCANQRFPACFAVQDDDVGHTSGLLISQVPSVKLLFPRVSSEQTSPIATILSKCSGEHANNPQRVGLKQTNNHQ